MGKNVTWNFESAWFKLDKDLADGAGQIWEKMSL